MGNIMKKLITVCQVVVVLAVLSAIAIGADQIINYDERMVGANHPTLADTLNRGLLVGHNADGTHNATGGTIDNTVIGGTTPVAGTFTTGEFSSLSVGAVDNTEIGYLSGVTSAIQTQITAKAPIVDPTFTNNVTVDNTLTAQIFVSNCLAADNNCFINIDSEGDGTCTAEGEMRFNRALSVLRRCNSGLTMDNVSGGSGGTGTVTPSSTDTFTNKTIDTSATGNVLKQTKYMYFGAPSYGYADTVYDNTYHNITYSGTADHTNNCAVYEAQSVPPDLDTSVDLAALLTISLGAADTGAHTYIITGCSTAASAGQCDDTNGIADVTLAVAADASGAQYDIEYSGGGAFTTLTNWKSSLTAGQLWTVIVCRDGDSDASTQVSHSKALVIRYGSTQ
jgi:hypothetical protein